MWRSQTLSLVYEAPADRNLSLVYDPSQIPRGGNRGNVRKRSFGRIRITGRRSILATMGRKAGVAARFFKSEGMRHSCSLCGELICESKQKQVARLANHIYCDCKRATAEQRRAVAQHHRTKCIATRMKQERAAAVQKAQLAAIRAAERGGSNSAVAIASGPAASAIVTSAGLPLGSELDSKFTQKDIDTYMDTTFPKTHYLVVPAGA